MPWKAPKKSKKIIRVPGYRFAGIHCGIKTGKIPDLALIFSEVPAKVAACFTRNLVKAAPLIQGQEVVRDGRLQAILINSGNANAVTGPQGLKDALRSAKTTAAGLSIGSEQVLVSSTGKIGAKLPMKALLGGIPKVVKGLSEKNFLAAAEAIRTTDRFAKYFQLTGKIKGKPFHVTGIAKGAGMIEPDMATMLAYILTDLDIALPLLRRTFREVVEQTFNSISVDGDTSTNDTALCLANGTSGLRLASADAPGFQSFRKMLFEICHALAFMMVQDGEGATKAVQIRVKGAKSVRSARVIADTISHSPLVKTSFFGEDPNWGRVFAAVGYSGETFDPTKVDISYDSVLLLRKGNPRPERFEKSAHRVMKQPFFTVTVDLNQGSGEASVLTSDLTYEYVKINAEYRT